MLSKLLEFKMPLVYLITLIFTAGMLYQRSEANDASIRAIHRAYVRADVQSERDARIAQKLDMLLEQIQDLKTEVRNLRSR